MMFSTEELEGNILNTGLGRYFQADFVVRPIHVVMLSAARDRVDPLRLIDAS